MSGADSGVNLGDCALGGMASLSCFPRAFCWIRDSDLLGDLDGPSSIAAAAITDALLLPGFPPGMLPAREDLRDPWSFKVN